MKPGLEILYAKPEPKDGIQATGRALTKELRERYWIHVAGKGWRKSLRAVSVDVTARLPRASLGRNRDEPGDGFRYVYRMGASGPGGQFEWIEVTEVFDGLRPKC